MATSATPVDAAAGAGGDAAASGDSAATTGSALQAGGLSGGLAGSVFGGGFAQAESPPPASPPAPPGMVILDPSSVDNTMQFYSVASSDAFLAVLAVANARNCTSPCSSISVEADITLAADQTLLVNNTMLIQGACEGGRACKVDGGGATQLMRVSGFYAFADVRNLEFANGEHNSAAKGVFGGAGGRAWRPR